MNELYQRYIDTYRNLNLFPLIKSEDIERFRITHSPETLARLRSAIVASEANGKLIFTGHRGCGKTTLLNELALEVRKRGLFVEFFSIADMVEMSDVNHINILYAIALRLLRRAIRNEAPIPAHVQEDLKNWFTQTKTKTYTDQLKQEMGVGGNFFEVFTAKLQKEDSFREEIKETYERRVSDLTQHIDQIAAAIQVATGKEVLVIIDDLDKLDLGVVEPIFRDNINALFSPRIRILFTIPIAVVREPALVEILESQASILLLSVTKFYSREASRQSEAQPIEANVARLQSILERRIGNDLIEPEVLRQMVLLSGGVLRELVRLGQECCRECMLRFELEPEVREVKIDGEILTAAVRELRKQYARPLGNNLYELLRQTYELFTPPDTGDPKFLELLHGLYVLEYENDDLWYDLHPLVTDLLKRKNLI
ncbi:P-loop NTPase fold protein [Nodosilinea sp. PGN35]|uniref:P-loop NTPase fold protein n=1 Tax=Nodosilinea sp. PGN35 TaxID=3020489 RepID=UPI0023B2D019|nr:ATP-binding protein [Nodosilinea sp. TSF1-S3]